MSAPTPANGGHAPGHGFYPDPSIPGYVRYWNGSSWVPGTSRPAPAAGEPMPAPPPGAAPTASPAPNSGLPNLASVPAPGPSGPSVPSVEETGPFFFDEEEDGGPATSGQRAGRELEVRRPAEPAVAWQADTARQNGFHPADDRRVSWGSAPGTPDGTADPRARGSAPGTTDPRVPGPSRALPARAERPALESPPSTPTASPRPDQGRPPTTPRSAKPTPTPDGTLSIRAVTPATHRRPTPRPVTPQPTPQGQVPPQGARPTPQPASWAHQVNHLASSPSPEPGPVSATRPAPTPHPAPGTEAPPVVPWKPPVEDVFAKAAREQASARPAGLGRRLAARLLDTVVLGAAVAAVAVPLAAQAVAHIDEKIREAKLSGTTVTVYLLDGTTLGLLGIVLGTFLVLGVLYEAVPTAKWGRTLGKKVFGLQVRDIEEHQPPRFGGALRRWLVYGVLGVLGIGVLNVLWCLVDRPWRQCWHDKAGRTFVAGRS